VNWLLDVVPPDYRLHGVLVRHPVALATLARHHLAACVAGARQGYRTARAELGKDLPPGGLAAVLAAYQAEGQRLVAAARSVELVERALRGETFVPQLAGSRAGQQETAPASERTAGQAQRAPSPGRPGAAASQPASQPQEGARQTSGRTQSSRRPGDGATRQQGAS
jgi:hypothetical protein